MEVKQYTYKNKEEINNIYIHDSYFGDINVNINNKEIHILLKGKYLENKGEHFKNESCTLSFQNVIHFECNRLDLWGGEENRILDLYLEEDDSVKQFISSKVKKEQEKCYPTPIEFIQDTEKFISICILTNTGDVTNIVCEKMILMG